VLDIPPHKLARVEELQVPVRGGGAIAARLYAPNHDPLPLLVYFHGGGFTVGSVATHDSLCRHLSHLAQCAVVSVDYRLAPEHKFPTAVYDAWEAVQWLAGQGDSLGLDASQLAVGGDSAGGTLAAVCAILARDAGLPLARLRTRPTRRASCWKRPTSPTSSTSTSIRRRTATTGVSRR
jgi:acetyl esterase